MPYVGHRPILPGQNSGEWRHNVTGETGVYSNWSLQSSIHLLEEVGDPSLPSHAQYSRSRLLSQMYQGEHRYAPMEFARFSHGGQDAPHLRHAHWEFHGVTSSEVFPRFHAATAAYAEMGEVAEEVVISSIEPITSLTFDINVDGGGVETVSITQNSTYNREEWVAELNAQTTSPATFLLVGTTLAVQSDSTNGSDSSVVITNVNDTTAGSGVQAVDVVGDDAHGISWGYSVYDERDFTFSRWSNHFFHGVPSADSTLEGTYWKAWDYENLPIYARRHEPFVYKGVGDDRVEDPGESLDTKLARGEESNEHAFQRTQEWHGVPSSQAL